MQKKLKGISKNIMYMPANHDTDRPILAVISGSKSSLIIDSGNSSKHARLFQNELEKYNITNTKYVVITHWHWDHIFGINEMNLITIANEKTKNQIIKMKNYEWTREALDKRVKDKIEIPFCAEMIKKEFGNFNDIKITCPDVIFDNRIIIDLGGITCVVENVGGDHSSDSTVIYVEEEKVLFLGDCLGPDIYNGKWSYDIDTVLALLNKLESYDADIYIQSHWKPENKEEFLNYINDIRKIAYIVKRHAGKINRVKVEAEEKLNRCLTQDDYELIEFFINGLG